MEEAEKRRERGGVPGHAASSAPTDSESTIANSFEEKLRVATLINQAYILEDADKKRRRSELPGKANWVASSKLRSEVWHGKNCVNMELDSSSRASRANDSTLQKITKARGPSWDVSDNDSSETEDSVSELEDEKELEASRQKRALELLRLG